MSQPGDAEIQEAEAKKAEANKANIPKTPSPSDPEELVTEQTGDLTTENTWDQFSLNLDVPPGAHHWSVTLHGRLELLAEILQTVANRERALVIVCKEFGDADQPSMEALFCCGYRRAQSLPMTAGASFTGASLTALTVIVEDIDSTAVSTPLFAVPPLSLILVSVATRLAAVGSSLALV